jgi:hypothetical protein
LRKKGVQVEEASKKAEVTDAIASMPKLATLLLRL